MSAPPSIWAFIGSGPDGGGIISTLDPVIGAVPLVCFEAATIDSMRFLAQEFADQVGLSVQLVRFDFGAELETIHPKGELRQ